MLRFHSQRCRDERKGEGMRERERVALHAINDRFSFTEKEKRGEAKAKGNVT